MILTDRDIRSGVQLGRILIEPFDSSAVQPASIDMTLADTVRVFTALPGQDVDPEKPETTSPTQPVDMTKIGFFRLMPGQFLLGSTLEKVRIPDDLVARIEGKSSLGRLGLMIHATAGYVDPGFSGDLTLEIANVSANPILLRPGMKIAQLALLTASSPAERPYGSPGLGSKYQGQRGTTPSRSRSDTR